MRKKRILQYSFKMMALMFTVALIACASTQNKKAMEMEKLLAASGFEIRLADTPEKLAQAKQLPQRKLVAQELADRVLYVYADAHNCQCVYAGSEEAYRRYQKLALEKQIAAEDRLAEERDKPKRMDWGEWRFNESW
jgi:hypothetical protein